ncbi:MAG TPA: glycosyltransferase [Coriobacteriia bacterium]|nr:glycosyltransferase [Coriobacteriia bacterium]
MKILAVHPGATVSIQDVWSGLDAALRRAGHDVIAYALDGRLAVAGEYLHAAWKRSGKPKSEHPSDADVIYWASQGIVERALRMQVDWVLITSGMYCHPDALVLLRRAGIRVAVLLTESPYDQAHEGKLIVHADACWTNERASLTYLRMYNPAVEYLPHAYAPERHTPTADDSPDVPAHDVVFVGTGFAERVEMLNAVDWSGIDVGIYGLWDLVPKSSPLQASIHPGAIDNRMTAALYRKARIGLNLYRSSMGYGLKAPRVRHAESLNPRALELAACGVFTLSDFRAEVYEVFGPLVPTFRDAKDLGDLVRRWLADDGKRRAVAAQLPAAVAGRTFDDMAAAITARLAQ